MKAHDLQLNLNYSYKYYKSYRNFSHNMSIKSIIFIYIQFLSRKLRHSLKPMRYAVAINMQTLNSASVLYQCGIFTEQYKVNSYFLELFEVLYMAIMTPLKPRMGRLVTLVLALLTWVVGIIMGMPSLLYYKTYRDTYSNGEERIICYPEWPDGLGTQQSLYEYYFNVTFLVVTYLVPILSMTYTYARIGIELWGSQSIGECTQRQMDNIKSKRRVVKMMMVVVIIFAVCWLPFQLYFIVTSYYPEITNSAYIQETFLAIYWLAMSNSMYNPIIYCWMNARFRRGFKQIFSCLPFVNISPGVLTRREVLTSKRRSYSGSPDRHRNIRNGTIRGSTYNPYTSIVGGTMAEGGGIGSGGGNRPSPCSSSTNTCYSHVPDDMLVLRRYEMRQMPS
ncbi:hypothetical protein ABEB36_014301 [Hypothenemus hampei]|uniref:G-protein coupled receptors family 1 profile domain-containing protein n=1 Tax=Hypothenemus hampei TaxID=57062 RepID=A0ABD1E3Y0_HYPHA